MRIVWIIYVTVVRINELELLNFPVHECFHRDRNFAQPDLQVHSKVVVRLFPLAFVTLRKFIANVLKCFILTDNKAIVDVKNEEAYMLQARWADISEEARLVWALNKPDGAEVGSNLVIESAASLFGTIVRLSQNSDVAGIRVSIRNDD